MSEEKHSDTRLLNRKAAQRAVLLAQLLHKLLVAQVGPQTNLFVCSVNLYLLICRTHLAC
jgi:hypothetical protein